MATSIARDITEAEIAAYEADGCVLLPGLFDRGWVEMLRERADHVLANPGALHNELAKADGRFFSDTFLWHQNDGFERFIRESPAAGIAAQIMRSAKINIVFDQFLIKEPATDERTVWHHDLTYWPLDGDQVCTLWLALDEVDGESGAMEFVKGSHRWGERYKAQAFVDPAKYKEDLPPVPDIDAMRGELDFAQFEYKRCACSMHHGLLLHGAHGNTRPDRRRRAYITRWAGDDVVYYPRPDIQPMLWDPAIAAGDPLDSDLWPVVWQAEMQGANP